LHLTIVNAFGFWVTKKADEQEILIEKEGKDSFLIFSLINLLQL
jgi:hypothetical protein